MAFDLAKRSAVGILERREGELETASGSCWTRLARLLPSEQSLQSFVSVVLPCYCSMRALVKVLSQTFKGRLGRFKLGNDPSAGPHRVIPAVQQEHRTMS